MIWMGIATNRCPVDGQNRVIFIDEGQPRNMTNYAFNRGDWFGWGGSASAPQPGSPFRGTNVTVLIAAVTDDLLGQATRASPRTPKGKIDRSPECDCPAFVSASIGLFALDGEDRHFVLHSGVWYHRGEAPCEFMAV